MNDMAGRCRKLANGITAKVVGDDAFGLVGNAEVWKFLTDDKKLAAFNEWFSAQAAQQLLTPIGGTQDKPWTAKYVEDGYKRGLIRAYADSRKVATVEPKFYEGGQAEFLKSAFESPEAVSKLRLLHTRAYEQLKGITAKMSADISRTLATGLAAGHHPNKIASELVGTVHGITRERAMVLARTEIIHAHAEGQLDAFEELGVEELGLEAELSTAGDGKVCARCSAARKVYTVQEARGVIPVHPRCRCCFTPHIAAPTGNMWKPNKKSMWGAKA
jgi:SPP1 gp7 family putative phage head morphogenesis protein